jgi:5-formyltetrahydrofolate cyclo-ligase
LKSKPELRRELMARRAALTPEEVAAASSGVLEQLQETIYWRYIHSVHVYRSVAEWGELDTNALVEWLAEEWPEIEVVQPSLSKDQPFPEQQFDLIFVPALGYDDENNRLGLGGGWYDRFVAQQPWSARKIGLAYAWGRVEDGIPVERWDMKLDGVVTSPMDPIRRHLAQREVASHVIEGGIYYLVSGWKKLASEVEGDTEEFMWEEWMNDLDGREIIQDLLDNVPESRAATDDVEQADKRFAAFTIPTDECEWGAVNAADNGWTREKNWWYWRKPRTPYV